MFWHRTKAAAVALDPPLATAFSQKKTQMNNGTPGPTPHTLLESSTGWLQEGMLVYGQPYGRAPY